MSERGRAVLQISGREDAERLLRMHRAVLVYATAPNCGICEVVWPKLYVQLEENYPELVLARLNTVETPDAAAFLSVHTVPTILVFFEGREHHRFSHAFGINEIGAAISRPYHLLFQQNDIRD